MTKGVQENRAFFRIQDQVILEFVEIDEATMLDDSIESPLQVAPSFYLLNELHSIDTENNVLLHAIAEKNRDIGTYLKSINQKIELIARAFAEDDDPETEGPQQLVTISEGGLSFNHKTPILLGTCVALKLILLPSYMGLLLYGRVVNCNEHIKGDYLINIVFEKIRENERQLLARHVLQLQAKARREGMDESETNTPLTQQ